MHGMLLFIAFGEDHQGTLRGARCDLGMEPYCTVSFQKHVVLNFIPKMLLAVLVASAWNNFVRVRFGESTVFVIPKETHISF